MNLPKTEDLKQLCKQLGKKYIGFRGNPRAPIWIVGEAPGADEDQIGLPFVGSSGRELDKMLLEAGLKLEDCCMVNPYKVRPPQNDIERVEETGIKKEVFEDQFFEELSAYRPSFVIPCGGTALGLLCPTTIEARDNITRISKWRGSILCVERNDLGLRCIPNFHPAYILREWSDRDVAVFVFSRVKEELEYWKKNNCYEVLPERELIVEPPEDTAIEFLKELIDAKLPVSADIELIARRVPITIGLSNDPKRAISIALFDPRYQKSSQIWRLLDRVLSARIIGQNYTTFDINWLEALGFSCDVRNVDDTLVLHHVLYPEMSHKLDFIGMQFSRQPYWKDEGRGWRVKEGLSKLMRYNALDAAVTLEAYQGMLLELAENPTLEAFYRDYEMPLARAFHNIDKKGILVDQEQLGSLRDAIRQELSDCCFNIAKHLGGRPCAYSQSMAEKLAKSLGITESNVLNIASVQQLKDLLKNTLKIKLAIDRKTHKESTGEESLNEAFAKSQSPVLKDILRTRELNKMLGTYVDAKLCSNVFYSCYSVTGTVTGRRASRKTFLGYGSNGQNQPKHSDLGARFQGVFISRPGFIFVYCDQASAEEWIVQGIIADVSGDVSGIRGLEESIKTGISRHAVLAAQLFGLPIEQVNDKECLHYYIGKKTRHACNYDMRENTMASQLAAEGFSVGVPFCKMTQTKFHEVEPNIRKVFHEYIRQTVSKDRRLCTPLGRERVFYGLNPSRDNGKIFREAFAYIPQSSIGDNNGMAILYCEQREPGLVVQDGHDSMMLEVPDNEDSILHALALQQRAYDRVLKFPNGFEVKVPIDQKLGYSIKGLAKCPANLDVVGLRNILATLRHRQSHQPVFMSGQPLPQSALL